MVFEYKCSSCGKSTLVEFSMKDEIPKTVACEACGENASRVWGNMTIRIPEYMKAVSSVNDGGYADFDNLKSRFKNAKRPSGKDKVYY